LPGLVHLRPSPDAPPFVLVGQTVKAGDTVCLIEAMKVFNSVRAERAGTIAAVLVTSESEVEAGQTLMRIV
jgi:acetyl-CoA carboxylase biotin carboxyl carrier protein